MSVRMKHTAIYAGIVIVTAPIVWTIGLVDVRLMMFGVVTMPIAYFTGFRDGEKYGE